MLHAYKGFMTSRMLRHESFAAGRAAAAAG